MPRHTGGMKEFKVINTEAIPHVALNAINHVLGLEGGYVNSAYDKGGKTNFGISDLRDGKADGLIDINLDGIGDVSPENLTYEQAVSIFFIDYWLANHCEKLPEHIALMVFDTAVNQGGSFARKTLQHTLGVKADGIIGGKTLGAVYTHAELELLTAYTRLRCLRYTDITRNNTDQLIFISGWINRAFDVLNQCITSATFGSYRHDK